MPHQKYQACMDACDDCADACDYCLAACLKEPDVGMMAQCIALDIDCAQLCRMSSSYMARGSEFAVAVCQMCADVCDSCADECGKHQVDHCQECAKACRRCSVECRRMCGMAPPEASAEAEGSKPY